MKRLTVEIDDPSHGQPTSRDFEDPNEAHRYADAQARQLPADGRTRVYDNEARAYCGHYCGQAEPHETPEELPTFGLYAVGSEGMELKQARAL